MKPAHPTLPDEVMERLAIQPRLRLAVGPPGNTAPYIGWAAPLKDQLYVLLIPTPDLEKRLGETPACELRAEDPDGDWLLTCRGRLHLGRTAQAEDRRNELFHWVPEGQSAGRLNAAVFFPELVDYQRTERGERVRAFGPVPGGAPPGFGAAWTRVAFDGVLPWVFGLFAIDWIFLIFMEDRLRNPAILLVMVGVGVSLLAGTNMLGVRTRYAGWRRAAVDRRAAEAIFAAGLGPEPLRTVGLGLIGGALIFTLLLMIVANGLTAFVAVMSSGAPVLLPFTFARYKEKAGI